MLCMIHDFTLILHSWTPCDCIWSFKRRFIAGVNTFLVSPCVSTILSCDLCMCFVCVCVCDQKTVATLCVPGERGVCRTSVSVSNARVSQWNPFVAATAPPTTMTVSCVWPSARNRGRLRWPNLASVMKVGLCVHVCDKITELPVICWFSLLYWGLAGLMHSLQTVYCGQFNLLASTTLSDPSYVKHEMQASVCTLCFRSRSLFLCTVQLF